MKCPALVVFSLPDDPKCADGDDLLVDTGCLPIDDLVSNVWFLEILFISPTVLPAFGKVHFGGFSLVDGLAEASGTYLPGPTEFGED